MLNQGLFLTNSTSFEHKLKVTSIIYLGYIVIEVIYWPFKTNYQ
jgi:hypothetical protein